MYICCFITVSVPVTLKSLNYLKFFLKVLVQTQAVYQVGGVPGPGLVQTQAVYQI